MKISTSDLPFLLSRSSELRKLIEKPAETFFQYFFQKALYNVL